MNRIEENAFDHSHSAGLGTFRLFRPHRSFSSDMALASSGADYNVYLIPEYPLMIDKDVQPHLRAHPAGQACQASPPLRYYRGRLAVRGTGNLRRPRQPALQGRKTVADIVPLSWRVIIEFTVTFVRRGTIITSYESKCLQGRYGIEGDLLAYWQMIHVPMQVISFLPLSPESLTP